MLKLQRRAARDIKHERRSIDDHGVPCVIRGVDAINYEGPVRQVVALGDHLNRRGVA